MELDNEMFIYEGWASCYHGRNISYMIKLLDPTTMAITICFRNPKDPVNYKHARAVLRKRFNNGVYKVVRFAEVARFFISDELLWPAFLDYVNYFPCANFTHFTTYYIKTMFGDNLYFMKHIEDKVVIPLAKELGKEYHKQLTF